MTSFKIYFNDQDIRRISTDEPTPSLSQLHELLLKNYKHQYHPELVIQYVDDEGDKITVTSNEELSYMYALLEGTSPIKIYISNAPGFSPGQYFKDGPTPEPVRFYTSDAADSETTASSVVGETAQDLLAENVSRCLESLFPGGKILPYHIPDWLREHISVRILRPGRKNEVDLDINIPGLYRLLHKRALSNLENGDLAAAQAVLIALLILSPRDTIAHYNLACAYALDGKPGPALDHAERAVELGYRDVDHLKADDDLNSIRAEPRFVELLTRLEADVRAENEAGECADGEWAAQEAQKEEEELAEAEVRRKEEEMAARAEAEKEEAEAAARRAAAEEDARTEAKRREMDARAAYEAAKEEAKKREEEARSTYEAARLAARKVKEEAKQAKQEARRTSAASKTEAWIRRQYPSQLEAIRAMGFESIDLDVLATLLKKYKGDVVLVVEHLL